MIAICAFITAREKNRLSDFQIPLFPLSISGSGWIVIYPQASQLVSSSLFLSLIYEFVVKESLFGNLELGSAVPT